MMPPAIAFTDLLKTLAGQFIDQKKCYAECTGDDFGTRINSNTKHFFSICLVEVDLPADLAAVGVLCDDSVSPLKSKSFTFFIYVDSSRKFSNITEDLRAIVSKLILSHETCHFAFYYELYLNLGANLTNTVYDKFRNTVAGKLAGAITEEKDITSQTIVEEHSYKELIATFGNYPDSHYAKKSQTKLDYNSLFLSFFKDLTRK